MSLKRLQQEILEFAKNKNELFGAAPDDEKNLYNWTATVKGPVKPRYTIFRRRVSMKVATSL